MKDRLTPRYINLIYTVLLKSFRREQSLHSYLRSCEVPDKLLNTWRNDETKGEFLDRIIPELMASDKGRSIIQKIAKFLMYQRNFPDLEFLIDADKRISEAREAVKRLRDLHWQQEEEIYNQKMKQKNHLEFQQQRDNVDNSLKILQDFNVRLTLLSDKITDERSYLSFKEWFFDLMDFYDVQNKRPYYKSGIESEGSISIQGIPYLVWLKFSEGRASVTDIDKFYQRVILDHQHNHGLMVSISGYSTLAIEEASGPKTPLLLMDHHHIFYVLSGIMGFKDLIMKLQSYTDNTGEAYLSPTMFNKV